MTLHTQVTWTLIASLLLVSVPSVTAIDAPREQDFVVTAYYSPLPGQCCYVRGSLEADQILNGRGTHAADGTPVYAGMAAAPASYAFGTRLVLPGLGVFTVHDRGGAINEWTDAHRIDLWVGSGEEGLARALAFGVRRMRGTVYPRGTDAPGEQFSVERLSAPFEVLRPYVATGQSLPSALPAIGERGLTVRLLQEHLQRAGYYDGEVTGFFGHATQRSLAALIADTGIDEPDDRLTPVTNAYLQAAVSVAERKGAAPVPFVNAQSDRKDIAAAQRLMRSLGYYRGRTDGVYGASLQSAILAYQQARQLVGSASSPGAGTIGPLTQRHLADAWKRQRIRAVARQLLDRQRIHDALLARGELLEGMLATGMTGPQVRRAQELLADRGFFPRDAINGSFGPLTKESVLRFQIDRGIVTGAQDTGAGMIGPQTLAVLTEEQVSEMYRVVRANGWSTL